MIDKWLNKIDRLSPYCLFWGIVGTSIFLAAWMQYIQHGWVNPDSLLYFEQARLFSQGDWLAGFNIFQWPLYGACIALVHKLSTLPIQTSAQLLNMLFFGLATASYLRLIKLAGGANRTLFFGALLLFSAQYIVGDILEMLMRDEGFWAFFLTAIVFFIRYHQSPNLRDALLWQVSIIIATLFRIEAIVYLALLPLLYTMTLTASIREKLYKLLNSYSLSLMIAITISAIILINPDISMLQLGRLNEIFTTDLYHQFTQKLFTQSKIMSEQVLGRYLDEFAIPGLLLTFTYVIISKILTATGLIGTGLAFLSIRKSSIHIPEVPRRVFLITIIIALITAALIITKVFVLSSRYVVALAWILLIFASSYLTMLSTKNSKKSRIVLMALCVMLTLGLVKNTLPKRDGYNYRQTSIAWLKQENQHNYPVFYNEVRLRYYANEPYAGTWADTLTYITNAIEDNSIHEYQYLVIATSKKERERLSSIMQRIPEYKRIKKVDNAKGKKFVSIYRRE